MKLVGLSPRHRRFIEDVRDCLYHLDLQSQQSFYKDVRFLFASHQEHAGVYAKARAVKGHGAGVGLHDHMVVGVGFDMDAPEALHEWEQVLGDSTSFRDVYEGRVGLSQQEIRLLFDEKAHGRQVFLSQSLYGDCWQHLRANERLAIEEAFFQGGEGLVGSKTRFYRCMHRYGTSGHLGELEHAMADIRRKGHHQRCTTWMRRCMATSVLMDSRAFLDEKTQAAYRKKG